MGEGYGKLRPPLRRDANTIPLVDGAFDLEFSMKRMQQHPRATESTFSLVATLLAPISKEKSSDRICHADIWGSGAISWRMRPAKRVENGTLNALTKVPFWVPGFWGTAFLAVMQTTRSCWFC